MSAREWLKEKARKSSLTDWIIVLFTALLLLATLYQFLIIGAQLDAMRKDERPWIQPTLSATPQIQGAIVGDFSFANHGKSPATSVTAKVVVDTVRSGERPKFDYPHPYMTSAVGILYPDMPTPKAPIFRARYDTNGKFEQNPFSPAEIADATQSKISIIAYGTITYADIFGKNHWARFCQVLWFGGLPLITTGQEPQTSCASYSETDHD